MAGCHGDRGAVLLVVVTASGSPPAVAALDVTITGPAGMSTKSYRSSAAQSIAFPTTLSAELPARALGSLSLDVTATDTAGNTLATGHAGPLSIAAGAQPTIYVQIACAGGPCVADAGVVTPDAGATSSPRCGNGIVDLGETCDTAIAAGDPGACPPADCNDGVACTTDVHSVAIDCTATCSHQEITTPSAIRDGCCPAGATAAIDPDCSATCGNGTVDPGETCDTGIGPGNPGACPGAADCPHGDACAIEALISAGTCSAICVQYQITAQVAGDGCCPPGGTNALDADCPIACGDGVAEAGETCDVGIALGKPGACPTGCESADPCTLVVLNGTACTESCTPFQITQEISGDGCCLKGSTHATDTDCPGTCGDGIVEPGETCDEAAGGADACPTSCPPSPSPCLQMNLVGSAIDCSAHCVPTPLSTCSAERDACCPAGCTAATDADCSPTCGDGAVAAGELCDTAIAAGLPGACPTACNDGDPCTTDLLLSAGTCSATCVHLRVTALVAGDACCPPGADFTVDPDCAPICGNGVVERPVEACDYAAAADSCPTSCPPGGACTTVALRGSPADCSASCVSTPIVACVGGDGCCPPGCTAATDSDCPAVCGDGVVESSEQCDRGITAGHPGACASSCNDDDACTVDLAAGSVAGCTRACWHQPITACRDNDGCCPAGCSAATDSDCSPSCGDGRIGAGETCDPPSTCPTTCPDDGDPCTMEQLSGDPAHCNVLCRHVPITSCSGARSDACCPTGCTHADDSDC